MPVGSLSNLISKRVPGKDPAPNTPAGRQVLRFNHLWITQRDKGRQSMAGACGKNN